MNNRRYILPLPDTEHKAMQPTSLPVKRLIAGACVWCLHGVVAAQAQADDNWRFQLTPYVWMSGLDGHIRPFQGAPTADVDKSFSDILKNLDAAFFLTGTARKGPWVLHADVSYASTSDAAQLPLGLSANARVRQSSVTLTGGRNWQPTPHASLDLLGGVRLWDIKATVQVPGVASAQSTTFFADPVIALRWRQDLAPRWSTLVYADVGGFGVGSDFTGQLMASINYQWQENWYLSLGYRHLRVNYRHEGRRLDFGQTGPLIGATYQF